MSKEAPQQKSQRQEQTPLMKSIADLKREHKQSYTDPATGPERVARVKALGGRPQKAKND